MCFPGVISAKYDKDDESTWKHWQTAEQKSTEEGRKTNPFATEDNRYDELSGQTFAIQTQRGGQWGSQEKVDEELGIYGENTFFGGHGANETVWQAMDRIDHRIKMESAEMNIKKLREPVEPGPSLSRGYDRSQSGGASGSGPGMSTADMINRRYA